jgi:pimeloyl-ACP methyl ester carboxylesterase
MRFLAGGMDARGRVGDRTVVLLHGLGATAEVWAGVRERLKDRGIPWVAPDLAGHGRSSPGAQYSFGSHASDVAAVLRSLGVRDGVLAVGHSMGGVVALALASGSFAVRVVAAAGIGIKVRWTEEELERTVQLAARPPKLFDTRPEAESFYLRVSGLAGLAEPGDELAAPGVAEEEGRFRLSADPATAGVGPPPMESLLAAARMYARVVLARGEHDGLVTLEDLRRLDPTAVELAGLGHNAHVEGPSGVMTLIDELATSRGS